jgi:hypothetical protein
MQRFKVHILAALGLLIVAGTIMALSQKQVLAALGYTPVRDITNGALAPISHRFNIGFPAGSVSTDEFTVPAGKRLVIESVSGAAFLSPGTAVDFGLDVMTNGVYVRHYFPSQSIGVFFSLERFQTSQAVRIYADPGSVIRSVVQKNNITVVGGGDFAISGHFVALP